MNAILRQRDRLIRIRDGVEEQIRQEAIRFEEFIAELNRDQLRRGMRGDGSSLPDYVPGSRQPQAPGHIQLFDKGFFYAGMAPIFEDEGLVIANTDEKTVFLVKRYGDILNLTIESRNKLRIALLPGVRRRIREL